MSHSQSHVATVYRRLLQYVIPHWKVVPGAFVAMILVAGTNAYFPFLLSQIVQTLEEEGRTGGSWFIPLMMLVTFAVRGSADFVAVYGLSWLGRSVVLDLRAEVFRHYTELPASYYDKTSSGTLISKLTYNTEQVAEAISSVVVVAVRDSLTIIVLLGAMIYFSPLLTAVVAIAAPVVGGLISIMSRAFRRYGTRIQTSMGDATRVTEEALSGHRIVKVFEGQDYQQRQFAEINERNRKQYMKLVATRVGGDALTQYTLTIAVAGMTVVAFSESLVPNMDAAVFMGFLGAVGLTLAPLKRLVNINAAFQRGIAAGTALFETLDEPAEPDTGTKLLERARGDIEFQNASFTYDESKGRVLNDVSFSAPSGTTIAIVGRSGSGKSTLVGLLPRFYDVDGGDVLLDSMSVRDYRLKDLRRQISLVSQDVVLFDDTIVNNIAYGVLADSSKSAVEEAAEAAYVTEFATELPDGLGSRVGERGTLLSGGQRQRIAIARALLKNAPVLILDEATSALDSESERQIQGALERLMVGRTTLVIAHRLSTVENADCIIVLKEGVVVEQGVHKELIAKGGVYSSLYRMQFAD
ncbi:MAG: lipid A export permease/ATP-binding protein MsbA [Pseudomonadota bacterium]|nr:lipid A export permease/ATP-binding protein MsbA [Pseudomonadota bacterium]